MINFQSLSPEEEGNAFNEVQNVIDMSHREQIFFDYLDESFFLWLAIDEKHGKAFNFYKDQRELLDWSVYSLTQAIGFLKRKGANFYSWMYSNSPRLATNYYLDNALFRMYATMERIYSFCNCWYDLNFEDSFGKLYEPKKLFKSKTIDENDGWANSDLLKILNKIRCSFEFNNCFKYLRHNIMHNLDPREYFINYNKQESIVEVKEPDESLNAYLNQSKKLLENIYKVRVLEAIELANSMSSHGVRKYTPADQDYWIDMDSPLF